MLDTNSSEHPLESFEGKLGRLTEGHCLSIPGRFQSTRHNTNQIRCHDKTLLQGVDDAEGKLRLQVPSRIPPRRIRSLVAFNLTDTTRIRYDGTTKPCYNYKVLTMLKENYGFKCHREFHLGGSVPRRSTRTRKTPDRWTYQATYIKTKKQQPKAKKRALTIYEPTQRERRMVRKPGPPIPGII
ncbi:uncharacterized protein LOC123685200 isoform X1 [Harmonia axyridis]|uniref:uncharacterized protein LOC123685200 isoform X1 n=1 Tax=Harmonia axyridis TaxID=115357 RepID=UPI001E2782EF|nr:uncharacterized protein LOC123685200 isoform X1 [Harmonia axyridis]